MQLVLGVLLVQLIIELAGKTGTRKTGAGKTKDKPEMDNQVQHPAAFSLRD